MNVSLTPELEKFVQNEVGSGLYQTASEVIRAGLRRLKEDQKSRKAVMPRSIKELEERLAGGIARLDRGEGIDADEVFERLAKKIARAQSRG